LYEEDWVYFHSVIGRLPGSQKRVQLLTHSCNRLTSPWRPNAWGWTAHTSVSITLAQQLASPFPLLAAVAPRREKLKLAPL